ncbi:hypothetical protein SAMN05661080_04501 [Modestobacter sp. DSM 44400]|uniref:hypothetical protein n=1 Tax=Modestobacter sp. DSM 44400 TaxID=1550230 RepID=UPI0008961B4F|nr:hypothetical protein [Modestobacter sp. DSM 44400]SDY75423.1 hypothetical protein SAMN05661080_04501 [Modestobacter sp. DSM 44400]
MSVDVKHRAPRADGMTMPSWGWVLIGWTALAVLVAVPMGRAFHEADRRERGLAPNPGLLDDRAAAPRRRRIPLPPIAVPLAGIGVALEAAGFSIRASGHESGTARLFAMDLPLSVPRLYVTALFVAAAGAAFLGASRAPGRRSWWIAVGVVTAIVAEVKGGGTVHVRALEAVGLVGHPVAAAAASAFVVAAVLTVLFWLSRNDRRDRRRVLGALGLYAVASVGLSSFSSVAGQLFGSRFAGIAATFVEESGEVVGGVAVLIAVLVGVAPRLVLPAAWALRRDVDAETIDAPGTLPTWSPGSTYLR